MALKDYPDWVLAHKGKGKEIRNLHGKYYLYLVHTERIDGKVKKFTDKYLGRITEDGLIPPSRKKKTYIVKKYGLTAFIFSSCDNIIQSIITRFPSRSKKILPLAILKYFFNNNLKEYNRHYVSVIFPNVVLKKEKDSIKNEIDRIASMFDYTVSKSLGGISLGEFKKATSSLYIVGYKDEWTIAKYDDDIRKLIEKYDIELEISYGKSK